MEGLTPLHVAVERRSEKHVRWYMDHDAPWEMQDNGSLTPGELALALGLRRIFNIIFEGAVRNEYRFWNLPLTEMPWPDENPYRRASMRQQPFSIRNGDYLNAPVTYRNPRPEIPGDFAMIDDQGNGVMMEWERPLMKESARLLCEGMGEGKSILNIGFGLGIIDSYFQTYSPANHTIIEAHPQCLKYMRKNGWYDKPNVRILEGRWQDFIGPMFSPKKVKRIPDQPGGGGKGLGRFDIIYFDTYQEGYLGHVHFLRVAARLMSGPSARLSFFHGHLCKWKLGKEIYAEVARWHALDVGINSEYHDFSIDPDKEWTSFNPNKPSREQLDHPWKIPICALAPTVQRSVRRASGWAAPINEVPYEVLDIRKVWDSI
ncbi:Protein arginine N-methyltransferase 2 [Grifola frondosa]|uniref:Protein arginine N-methyltransferase 2 n=1 Tax=Grifola frondosa TaxID=5627 RepID=A0A1C7LQB9_GRIFR|nr:Protein arginine N-methyltransferase 2 [Grifola frondosa]